MDNILPRLSLLTSENIQQIHLLSLRILYETGVRVDSTSVVEQLN